MADFDTIRAMMEYGKRFIGVAYRWGGDDPVGGFDCSGLLSECLRAFGFIRWNERLTSGQFAGRFPDRVVQDAPVGGDILVWPGHVALALTHEFMLEAGGGGPQTVSEGEAAKDNAFVRIRPISMRPKPTTVIRLAS